MLDKNLFGYQGLFSDRSSIGEALEYMTSTMESVKAGGDKVAMLTACFVVSNTLARVTTNIANILEQNLNNDIALIDGVKLNDLTLAELLQWYNFPFEEPHLTAACACVLEEFPNISGIATVKKLPPLSRVYFLMATPKKDTPDAESHVQVSAP